MAVIKSHVRLPSSSEGCSCGTPRARTHIGAREQHAKTLQIFIWNLVDNKTGCVTRSVLYKALALVAMAQQGKQPSDKLLENTESQELPVPTLGDLQDVVALAQRLQRSSDPTNLNLSYSEICDLDTLEINLVPEKKGIFLKHVEYQVTSKVGTKKSVQKIVSTTKFFL
uniref:Uncharacterized protein n=1 Tax=Trichogramma kaykai TaxID=54128 RepID=A0ABD2XL46_9HYME